MLTSMFAAGKTEREYNLYLCLIFPYKISSQWFLEKLPETGSHWRPVWCIILCRFLCKSLLFNTLRGTLLWSLKNIITGRIFWSFGSGTDKFMKGSYLIEIWKIKFRAKLKSVHKMTAPQTTQNSSWTTWHKPSLFKAYYRLAIPQGQPCTAIQFKVDRLQIILVAKKYISKCHNCSSVGC